jgi:hypothetical protein
MSWSFSAIGTPDKIAEALEAESGKLSGESKREFDDAKPHLIGLLRQNLVVEGHGYANPALVNFSASGSGSTRNGVDVQRQCSVKIEPMYARPLI